MPLFFQTLLDDLPEYFDKDSRASLVLSARHAYEVSWTIAENTLRIVIGLVASEIDLQENTVAELAERMRILGFTITFVDLEASDRSASILIDAASETPSQDLSFQGYTSILWAWVKALGIELDMASAAVDAMVAQLLLPQAYSIWADYWGRYFGVARKGSETDASYTSRIEDEVRRKRNNIIAMEDNILRYTGATVHLVEPWRRMWVLSKSKLDGGDHMPGEYYCYHTLHPTTEDSVDWDEILAVIDADRPAGTIIKTPTTVIGGRIIHVDVAGVLGYNVANLHSNLLQRKYRALSGAWLSVNMILSDARVQHVPAMMYGHLYSLGTVGANVGETDDVAQAVGRAGIGYLAVTTS